MMLFVISDNILSAHGTIILNKITDGAENLLRGWLFVRLPVAEHGTTHSCDLISVRVHRFEAASDAPVRISPINRVIPHIRIEILLILIPHRIDLQKASLRRRCPH
jgi:hypothetical protein